MILLPAFDEEGEHGFKTKWRLKMGEKYVNFFKKWKGWNEWKKVWVMEFLDKKDAICYTGISMWKESYKNEEIFCNPWASHFGIDWLFAIPNKENYSR